MNMKTAYKVYLFCCVLFLTGLFLLVPVYAVEDMWTAASRIIKDIYTHIASVSTVLAGLMTAIAVIGAKMSNTQQKSDGRIVHRRNKVVEVEKNLSSHLSSQVCHVKSYQRGNIVCTQRREELWKRNWREYHSCRAKIQTWCLRP